jgi:probable rRNA maturation factor
MSKKTSSQPSSPPISVKIANQQTAVEVDWEKIRTAVRAVLEGEGCKKAKISVALVDDPTIHKLNKRYLDHDYPTDVLTFPLEDGPKGLEGEIVVSSDTAISNAKEYNTTADYELILYIIHGVLHLMDYDDHDDADERKMRAKEQQYLAQIGLAKTSGGSERGRS